MYKKKWLNYYFPSKPIKLTPKWILVRKVGQDILSKDAQIKLEWIIFYQTIGKKNARKTSLHFGISPKTFHKWYKRFDEKDLKTLEEKSRRPKKVREWEVTKEEEEQIKDLRRENMELGKKKLQRIYLREYKEHISTWKIERVIRRYQLYPDKIKHRKRAEKKRRSKPKLRIHKIRKAVSKVKQFGFLWHVDTIIIWWYGQKRIIFTAIEDLTKIAFARVYTTNTSGNAQDFLKRLMYVVEGKVNIMHQDNGSEFKGVFERACQTLKILQVYSRPHTPQDNPSLERFNKTVQEEWLALSEEGLDEIIKANQDLTKWLIKYNSYRPHQSLDYQTPLEYAQKYFFNVLPMWSASTLYVLGHKSSSVKCIRENTC